MSFARQDVESLIGVLPLLEIRMPAVKAAWRKAMSKSPFPDPGQEPAPKLFHPDDDECAHAVAIGLDKAEAAINAARAQILAWHRPRVFWEGVRSELAVAADNVMFAFNCIGEDELQPETKILPAEPVADDAEDVIFPPNFEGGKGGGA